MPLSEFLFFATNLSVLRARHPLGGLNDVLKLNMVLSGSVGRCSYL